jgi:Na+-driven multidrug efflux pump
VALVAITLVVLPLAALADPVLRPFLHDPATRAVARLPLVVVLLGLPVDTLGLVLMNALLGAGDSRTTLAVTFTFQWLVLLPAAYAVGPVLGLGLVGVYATQLVARGAQAGVFAGLWQRGGWTKIRL